MPFLSIDAKIEELGNVRRFIEGVAVPIGIQGGLLADIRLAVDELITNTIVHGYGRRQGNIDIDLSHDLEKSRLTIVLRDQAQLFNPFTRVPQHDVSEKLGQEQPGGFGLQLVQKTMNETLHKVTDSGGNELTLVKYI